MRPAGLRIPRSEQGAAAQPHANARTQPSTQTPKQRARKPENCRGPLASGTEQLGTESAGSPAESAISRRGGQIVAILSLAEYTPTNERWPCFSARAQRASRGTRHCQDHRESACYCCRYYTTSVVATAVASSYSPSKAFSFISAAPQKHASRWPPVCQRHYLSCRFGDADGRESLFAFF